ncbi:MAG: hypothetical protein V1691_03205 [Chloroflexota bacterium]
MRRYHGGESVTKGLYLNIAMLEFVQLYQAKPALPGDAKTKYMKVPAALSVLAGPLAGLVFIIFLPFIGIVGLVSFIAYKAWQGVAALGQRALRPAAVGWKPGTAYLTRRAGKPEATTPEAEDELARLAKEVDRQRREEKK